MIDKETAKQLVLKRINAPDFAPSPQLEMVVLDEPIIEREFGWVFFYDSKLHVETGDDNYLLAGNAPIIVNKTDSSIHVTGTAFPIERYIEESEDVLERAQQKWALVIKDDPSISVSVLKRVKAALGLSLQDMAELKDRLPGVIVTGARRDLLPKVESLISQGVDAEIIRNGQGGS